MNLSASDVHELLSEGRVSAGPGPATSSEPAEKGAVHLSGSNKLGRGQR